MNRILTGGTDKEDLEGAAIAVLQASRLLADSIRSDSDELIESALRVSSHDAQKARFAGAMAGIPGTMRRMTP